MTKRGVKRSSRKRLPNGIRIEQLPDRVYWNASGNGHWYTSFFDANGKRRTKKIAGPNATLAELHALMEHENGVVRNTFRHISELFQGSTEWEDLSSNTHKDYRFNHKLLVNIQTKVGTALGDEPLVGWDVPMAQRLIDKITKENGPSSASHALGYGRRVFSWAVRRGHADSNPFKGVKRPKQRNSRPMPSIETYNKVLAFAKNHRYQYLWSFMEIAYLCRGRAIEVRDMRDSDVLPEGLLVRRTKGSRDTIVRWSTRLTAAWENLIQLRSDIFEKKPHLPVPINPADRFVFVTRAGSPLKKDSFNSAWRRLMDDAVAAKIITREKVFPPHGLKRRGVTDTKGNRADKQKASGHRVASMVDIYDQGTAVVDPPSE